MKCPSCGGAELVHDTREVSYTYKGESTILPKMKGDFCLACGDALFAPNEAKRVSALMIDFNTQVNATIIDPGYIVKVRKKLHLRQKEAGVIFGGGANAFSRYEKGRAKPPLALVKLLRGCLTITPSY